MNIIQSPPTIYCEALAISSTNGKYTNLATRIFNNSPEQIALLQIGVVIKDILTKTEILSGQTLFASGFEGYPINKTSSVDIIFDIADVAKNLGSTPIYMTSIIMQYAQKKCIKRTIAIDCNGVKQYLEIPAFKERLSYQIIDEEK